MTTTTSTATSILIVNWNGETFLPGCLDSIAANIESPHEIIVVDNCSTDGSVEMLSTRYPSVKLIRCSDNLGFAGGNNLAARNATGKYLLLLNNDTLLHTSIADAIAALEQNPGIGAVGAAMFGVHGERRVSCAHFPRPALLWRFASLWFTPVKRYPNAAGLDLRPCDFVEGSFMLTRTAAWQQLGGMDERNYMYGDDIEYCRSLLDLGQITVQCPSVRYTHFGGYDHSRMGYLFAGFRRYHRKFSPRRVQLEADFVLRVGLLLRLPWYWLRATLKKDTESRSALKHALEVNRDWSKTLIDAHRYHA
jgi:GT2 family glycosyltransferase